MIDVRVITDKQNKIENESRIPTRCNLCPARAEITIGILTQDNDGHDYFVQEYICRDCAKNLARILETARSVSIDLIEDPT